MVHLDTPQHAEGEESTRGDTEPRYVTDSRVAHNGEEDLLWSRARRASKKKALG